MCQPSSLPVLIVINVIKIKKSFSLSSRTVKMVEVSKKDIRDILQTESINSYDRHELIALSDTPIGFLADHFILRVHLSSSPFIKDFFLKAVPRNVEKRVEYLEETGFFTKEVQLYQILIPKLLKFSSSSWAPECYFAKDGHFIIMEILQDYKIKSTRDLTFDLDHLKVAAKTLAVFHASSLIFEKKTGCDVAKEYAEMLEENAYPLRVDHVRQRGFENAIEVLTELVKLIFKNSLKLHEILEKFPETLKTIFKYAQPSKKYKNVVSHGDLWVNNFMFKYEDETPVDCKFIDYQLARYAPPAFDLAQTVYINSTKEFRAQHLDEILNTYCNAFEMELKNAHLDPSTISRSELLESFKEFHLVGLIEACVFGHLTLLPSTLSTSIMSSSEEYDNFINQSRVETCLKAFKEDYYRKRMTEILSEIIEDFIIPSLK